MGFSYRKKIAPGVTLSFGKKGPSLSTRIGPKGAGVSVNTRGQVTGSVGAGGVRYQKRAKIGGAKPAPAKREATTRPAENRIVNNPETHAWLLETYLNFRKIVGDDHEEAIAKTFKIYDEAFPNDSSLREFNEVITIAMAD